MIKFIENGEFILIEMKQFSIGKNFGQLQQYCLLASLKFFFNYSHHIIQHHHFLIVRYILSDLFYWHQYEVNCIAYKMREWFLDWHAAKYDKQSPSSRCSPSSAVYKDYLIIFGGTTEDYSFSNECFSFDTKNKIWTNLTKYYKGDIPQPTSGHVSVVYRDSLFIHGGIILENYKLYEFNLITHIWKKRKDGPPLLVHSGVVYKDKIYLFGGQENFVPSNRLYEYNFLKDEWKQILGKGDIPSPRQDHSAAIIGDSMFIFGGEVVNLSLKNDFYEFNLISQIWKRVYLDPECIPTPRRGHSLIPYKEYIVIFGGESQKMKTNDIYFYHTKQRKMIKMKSFNTPCERVVTTCQILDDKMYVFGGSNGELLGDFYFCKLPNLNYFDIYSNLLQSNLIDVYITFKN